MSIQELCGQIDATVKSVENLFCEPEKVRGDTGETLRFCECLVKIDMTKDLAQKILHTDDVKKLEDQRQQIEVVEKAWIHSPSLKDWCEKRKGYFPNIASIVQRLLTLKSQLQPNQSMTIQGLCGQIDTTVKSLEDLFWEPVEERKETSRFIHCVTNINLARDLAQKILHTDDVKKLEDQRQQIEQVQQAWFQSPSLKDWREKRKGYLQNIESVVQGLLTLKSQLQPNQKEIPIPSSCFEELFHRIDTSVESLKKPVVDQVYFCGTFDSLSKLCKYARKNFPHSYKWGLEDKVEPVKIQVDDHMSGGLEKWNVHKDTYIAQIHDTISFLEALKAKLQPEFEKSKAAHS